MRQIVVHDVRQARAALAAAKEIGVPVQLRSAPDAAAYAGVGFLQALGEAAGHELVIDCGDDAGLVMAALRTGSRKLAFSAADTAVAKRLEEMAADAGARLEVETLPPHALRLEPGQDAGAAFRRWLED